MTASQTSSRLEMLQARFQQKQLQEKEQKLLQLYDQQQQRAYQVVQRGSAGSNVSSTVSSHHSITRASSHPVTVSSQKMKMFEEKRQTTVKGIDRSYPLEPLDNKPLTIKHVMGDKVSSQSKNDNTSRHQSVTVKRVVKADVNSNVNDGKPIVSYQEEVIREAFEAPENHHRNHREDFNRENRPEGFETRQTSDDIGDNNRYDGARNKVQIDNAMDQETIEKNRMMARIHLMEFDETMKHRVVKDIDSEKFPEEMMIDILDGKLGSKKRSGNSTKKLSQAEARLEKFRNSNAKRTGHESYKTTNPTSKRTSVVGKTNARVSSKTSSLSPSTTETVPGKKIVDANGVRTSPTTSNQIKKSVVPVSTSPLLPSRKTTTSPSGTGRSDPSLVSLTNGHSVTLSNGQSKPSRTMAAKTRPPTNLNPSNRASPVSNNKNNSVPSSVPEGLASCKICGRNFAVDRLSLHEDICAKTAQKKRKQFDAVLNRVKGTEFEQFVKKGGNSKKTSETKAKKTPETKSNWRRKHEDFINAIRSAKQMQAHLAAGGKLSDLPPPPPSDTSDYIQCPHCLRKFNQGAAERHIPKCENMMHNKPLSMRKNVSNKSRRN